MLQSLKTSYTQDISLLAHRGSVFWYGLLIAALLIVPGVLGEFYVNELGGVYIFAIAGVGLMLLTGYTGLVNLGQGAFLGIGAYTNSVLMTKGVPFVITLPLSGVAAALAGVLLGIPTLRMTGFYLAIATLAFGSIVGTIFQKWTSVTGGFDGFAVPTPTILGYPIEGANGVYYMSLFVLIFVLWMSVNILRSPVGRAMVAIRDSEVSAQSMGINLSLYKTISFAISSRHYRARGRAVRPLCRASSHRTRSTSCCRSSSSPSSSSAVSARCMARSSALSSFACCRR